MHAVKHYQKKYQFNKNNFAGKAKGAEKPRSEVLSKFKNNPDKKFYGDLSLVKSITAISRIKEEIRDQNLIEYIQDAEIAKKKNPGPEPERPDVQNIKDQIVVMKPIELVDDYEDVDNLDQYVEHVVRTCSIDVPNVLSGSIGTLEHMKEQDDPEIQAVLMDEIALLRDRVNRENKRRRKEHDAQLQHQKYLLELKRDKENDYDRSHKEWIRSSREYRDDTEKLSKLLAKHLGTNVKGLVKNELETKDYFQLMRKIEEHYVNFNSGNYTELFRTFLGTRIGKNQSIDSLGVYLDTLVDYLNRLKPEQPINDMLKLTTLETALESSEYTNEKLLDVVDMMKINATNGHTYTYEGLLQNLHLKETSQGYQKTKKSKIDPHHKRKDYRGNDNDQINNLAGQNKVRTGCRFCLDNGRKEQALTHTVDKCFLKQKRDRQKKFDDNKKQHNKSKSPNIKQTINQMEEMRDSINNILKANKASKRKDIKLKGYSDEDSESGESANMVQTFNVNVPCSDRNICSESEPPCSRSEPREHSHFCNCQMGIHLAILDSGCSSHMKREMPTGTQKFVRKIEQLKLPDATLIPSIGRADTEFEKDIMIVPSLHTDLHSTGAYDNMGCATIHLDGVAYVLPKHVTNLHRNQLKSMSRRAVVTAVKGSNNLYYIKPKDEIHHIKNQTQRHRYVPIELSELSEHVSEQNKSHKAINVLAMNRNLNRAYLPLKTWDTSEDQQWYKSLGIPPDMNIWVECVLDNKNMIFPILQESYPYDKKYMEENSKDKLEPGMTLLTTEILERFPGIRADLVGTAISIKQFDNTLNPTIKTIMPQKSDKVMSDKYERQGSLGTQLHIYRKVNKFKLLHERMAHQNIHTLYQSLKKKAIYGHNMSDEEIEEGYKNFEFCYACGMGKSTQFTRKSSEAEREIYLPGEMWYTDCVSYSTPSAQGNFYWFPYLDRASGLVKNYFGKLKTDVNAAHVQLITSTNLEHRRIKIIAGDDESIYNHPEMTKYLSKQLINWQSSAPYVHSQNRVERTIYTIQDAACTAMISNNCPEEYWQDAIEHVTYEYNRTFSVQLQVTHYEKYYNIRPDVSNLVAFFSRGIMHIPKELRHQLTHDQFQKRLTNKKGHICRVVGYATNMKNTFIVLCNGTRSVTANVVFDVQPSHADTIFNDDPNIYLQQRTRKYFYNTKSVLPATYTGTVISYKKPYYQVVYNGIQITEDYTIKELLKILVPNDLAFCITSQFDRSSPLPGGDEEYNNEYGNQFDNKIANLSIYTANTIWQTEINTLIKRSEQCSDFGTIGTRSEQCSNVGTSGTSGTKSKKKSKKIGFKNKRAKQSKGDINDYLQDENFKKAYKTEIDKVFGHGTLMLLKDKPKHSLKTRLVWDRIPRPGGQPDKYKCRWVACGYSQVPGRDFNETFSPTIKWRHLLVCFHIMAYYNLKYNEIDIGTAYLNAEVDTELYIQLPPEMTRNIPVYAKLLKNLYGLKQGARNFYLLLSKIILDYGLIQSKIDPCVYIQHDPMMFVTTQVDNINVWFVEQKTYIDFLTYLRTRFQEVTESIMPKRIIGINMHYLNIDKEETYLDIKELIEIQAEQKSSSQVGTSSDVGTSSTSSDIGTSSTIGTSSESEQLEHCSIQSEQKNWNCNTIIMEQFHYIEPIIEGIEGEKVIPIPSTINLNSFPKGDGLINLYEEMGTFRYLNDHTRPDFMTATTMMSSHMINPNEKHVQFTNKNMRQYIKHSKEDFKVIRKMKSDEFNMKLFAYCDGSYLQDYDCKSYIGFNFFLDTTSSSIFDKCIKDSTVSRSSTIVEIKAIDLCVLYTLTLRMFLSELGFTQTEPTTILTDSQPSLDILKNEQINDKVLYINVRIHFVREHHLLQEIIARKIGTEYNVSDTMTKCLAVDAFNKHKQILLYGHMAFDQCLKQQVLKLIKLKI